MSFQIGPNERKKFSYNARMCYRAGSMKIFQQLHYKLPHSEYYLHDNYSHDGKRLGFYKLIKQMPISKAVIHLVLWKESKNWNKVGLLVLN